MTLSCVIASRRQTSTVEPNCSFPGSFLVSADCSVGARDNFIRTKSYTAKHLRRGLFWTSSPLREQRVLLQARWPSRCRFGFGSPTASARTKAFILARPMNGAGTAHRGPSRSLSQLVEDRLEFAGHSTESLVRHRVLGTPPTSINRIHEPEVTSCPDRRMRHNYHDQHWLQQQAIQQYQHQQQQRQATAQSMHARYRDMVLRACFRLLPRVRAIESLPPADNMQHPSLAGNALGVIDVVPEQPWHSLAMSQPLRKIGADHNAAEAVMLFGCSMIPNYSDSSLLAGVHPPQGLLASSPNVGRAVKRTTANPGHQVESSASPRLSAHPSYRSAPDYQLLWHAVHAQASMPRGHFIDPIDKMQRQELQKDHFVEPKEQCRIENCKAATCASRTGYCPTHAYGSRRCEYPGCTKCAQGGLFKFCIKHGGGWRCQHPNCNKGARDRFFCARHGGWQAMSRGWLHEGRR